MRRAAVLANSRESAPAASGNWWKLIVLLAVPSLVLTFLSLASQVTGDWIWSRFGDAFWLVGLRWIDVVLSLMVPVAVYFDRRFLAFVSEWQPSRLYYLMVVPVSVSTILAIVYIYKRHKYVGVP